MKLSVFLIPVIIISALFGFFDEYILMYLALILHESAHLLAIRCRKLEIAFFKVEPFGMRISLKDEIIKKPSDEISVALAGPFVSIIIGLITLPFSGANEHICYFAYGNLYLGIFNLLPALPLDGGRVLRAFLSNRTGYLKSYNTVKKITILISVLLVLSGGYILFITRFNYSVCLIGAFLYFGILTEKNHFSYYLNKEISGYRTKNSDIERMPVLRIAVNKDYPVIKILEEITLMRYCIAEIIDGHKKLGEFTEGELIEAIINKGSDIRIKDIYN